MSQPAILVAATHSGAGKTTATTVILHALRQRGLTVQPFKIGPDFIDPAYHAEAVGRPSINLDVWMMGEDGVRGAYRRWSADADMSVIEAMGALYDGENGGERGSAAQVAKLLDVPVVVVLDAWGMTRTAGAILDGLLAFDPDVRIEGCLLNRVGGDTHASMVVEALRPPLRRLIVGALARRPELEVPERHLGLVTVGENATATAARQAAYVDAGRALDVDRLIRVAGARHGEPRPAGDPRPAGELRPAGEPRRPATPPAPVARLALARDAAFCFYYEENLGLLRDGGFELVPFSPIADPRLPPDVDAVYLGGGYPESFAAELAANRSLAAELRERAAAGTPIYAECGGLMFLGRSLAGFDGRRHVMAGVLPLDVAMDAEHLAIRYVEARLRAPSPLGQPGTVVRGQEFHQSRLAGADLEPTLYDVTASEGQVSRDGYVSRNVVASYVHLHFGSNPQLVANLANAAVQARR